MVFRLTGIDIDKYPNDGGDSLPLAERKIQQAIIGQKMEPSDGSALYDFNLHLALIAALRALATIKIKTGIQPLR